jgi:hypothetical protein
MVKILEEEKGETRDNIVSTISNLSVAPENKVLLSSPSLGLVKAIVHLIVNETEGDRLLNACGILLRLSVSAEARVAVANEEGLLAALVTVLKGPHAAAKSKVLGTFWNLAVSAENLPLLGAASLGLLPCLVTILRTDEGEQRISCCGILLYISRAPEFRQSLAEASLGLVAALVHMARSTSGPAQTQTQAQAHACGILNNLSLEAANQPLIALSPGLVTALTRVLQADDGEARANSIGALLSLATHPENRLLGRDPALLGALVGVLRKGEAADQVKVSLCLFHFASAAANLPALCSKDLALLPLVADLVQRQGGSLRVNLLGVLLFIFQQPENRAALATPALARTLVSIFRTDTGEAQSNAAGVLVDLSREEAFQKGLADPALALFPTVVAVLGQGPGRGQGQGQGQGQGAGRDVGVGQAGVNSLAILWHAALLEANRRPIATTPGMLPALVKVLGGEDGTARLNASGCLMNLSVCAGNKGAMAEARLGLLDAIVKVWSSRLTTHRAPHRLT